MAKITPILWFNNNAEDAAKFYIGIFKKSKITKIGHYGEEGCKEHGWIPGSVRAVYFQIEGTKFRAFNGGPGIPFNEAIAFIIECKTQVELDYYWNKLSKGGPKEAQECGWLMDKFGVSWVILPDALPKWFGDSKSEKYQRTMRAFLGMKKLNIAKLKAAHDGKRKR